MPRPETIDRRKPTKTRRGAEMRTPRDGDGSLKTERGAWAAPLAASPVTNSRTSTVTQSVSPGAEQGQAGAVAREQAPHLTHLRALDGLRGLAVLAVVLYHFAPGVAPGGFLGVDLFFVLSGFLITSLLVNEWEATRRISLPSFWARRARRLLPALFLVLSAVGVYALVLANRVDAQHVASDGLSAFTYVANWHFIASNQPYIQMFIHQAPSPLRHMWSLAIEEQFYLVWPILVAGVGWLVAGRTHRPGRGRRQFRHVLLAVCLTLGFASFLRMITLYHQGGDVNRVYYGTDTRAFIILIGAALGALSAGAPALVSRLRRPLIALGCCATIALVAAMAWLTTSSSWLYRGGYGVIAVVMVLVLAAAAQPGLNPLARVFTIRPLVGLGLISYGVYLWHWPIGLWLTPQDTGLTGFWLFAVRSGVTLAAAVASYKLVEQPIRRGRLPRWRLSNPGVVPLTLVTAVALLLLIPALTFPSVAASPTTGASTAGAIGVTARYAQTPRCDGPPASHQLALGRHIRVELVGNSIAKEINACLASILKTDGAKPESLILDGFHPCDSIQTVQNQVRNPANRPTAVIYFALDVSGCVGRFIGVWKAAGVHIYLVAPVPPVLGSSVQRGALGPAPAGEAANYQTLASQDPAHITVLDAGTFLRDGVGRYQWRMPCLPGEAGCGSNHTVGVRWLDGFHFCTDPGFVTHHLACPSAGSRAGERRAAAAVAAGLLPSLKTNNTSAAQTTP
jgi:peptidoglycan/LPS O-acetylase OafA/YrhL